MITELMKDSASKLVDALNKKAEELNLNSHALLYKIFKYEHNDVREWAKSILIEHGGIKRTFDLTRYKMHETRIDGDLSLYFVIGFMGGEVAIGLTGEENFYGDDFLWDEEFSYGLVKYKPYFSKGLRDND